MTEFQREIKRKKRVIEYAEKNGNIKTACRRFGIARSTFYLWRDRYRESGDEGLECLTRRCHTGDRVLYAHFADRERLFRSIVNAHSGDRERSGATLVSR